jgi:hypothetical protein
MPRTATPTEFLSFTQIAKAFDPPLSRVTVHRWHTAGLIGAHGRRVRLKAKRIGACKFTTREWVNEFQDKLG